MQRMSTRLQVALLSARADEDVIAERGHELSSSAVALRELFQSRAETILRKFGKVIGHGMSTYLSARHPSNDAIFLQVELFLRIIGGPPLNVTLGMPKLPRMR